MSSHRTEGDASRMSRRRFSASAASGPPRASNGSSPARAFPIAAFAPPRGSLRWPYPDDATGFFLTPRPGSFDEWAPLDPGSLRAHAGSLESSRRGGGFAGESLGVGALHTSGSRSGEGARFSLRARPPPRHMASSSSLERLGARPAVAGPPRPGAPARAFVDGGSGPSCTGPGRFAATCGTSPRARAAAALEPGRVENIPRSPSRFVTASSSSVSCRWTARHRPTRNGSAPASSSVLCTCLRR